MTGTEGRVGPRDADREFEEEVHLLGLVNVLLRRWRIVVALPILTALAAAAYSLVIPPTFTATTSFLSEVSRANQVPAGLAGLASQFGVSVGPGGPQSARLYAQILESRGLMERVVQTHYRTSGSHDSQADSASLLDIMEIEADDAAPRLDKGVKALTGWLTVRVDNLTNIVRISVDAPDRMIAADVANRFVDFLQEFNAYARQSQARNQRRFVEERIADAEQALTAAEEATRVFYERNRSWQRSPQLVFEEGRLRRRLEIRQEVYLTLRREYERVRIEEVNDTGTITIIDRAIPPTFRSSPKRRRFVILAFVVGGVMSVVWAFSAGYVDVARQTKGVDYQEFTENLRQIWQTIALSARRAERRGER